MEVLIGCLGSVAMVIIFLQKLEWELRGGGERGEKTSAVATISTAAVGVIKPSLYEAPPPLVPKQDAPTPSLCSPVLHIPPIPASQEAAGAACVYC